ncbi:hydrolase [Cyanobium sp. WAJ14-Wanaka]|uniref:Vgb family protein n=1 Tax=Cyanobium sp. WAJ14-Wanaka TaxID=2823725 RepID=UPI0020CD35DD|nr:hydrolase [Cyanobium sp. WAJ14-Wanaka]
MGATNANTINRNKTNLKYKMDKKANAQIKSEGGLKGGKKFTWKKYMISIGVGALTCLGNAGQAWATPVQGKTYPSIQLNSTAAIGNDADNYKVSIFTTPAGIGTRDVAPDPDGSVWFNGQWSGTVGHLNPVSKTVTLYPLGEGSHPHGIVLGPDGGLWICDESNAIRRFDRNTHEIKTYKLPKFPESMGYGNLNTPTFDKDGILWFTAQNGYHGRLDPKTGENKIYKSPGGFGPYGITTTPNGEVWYTNLAGNHIAKIDLQSGIAKVVPIPDSKANGSRRIWSDSHGNLWVTTWGDGVLRKYSPGTNKWSTYKLPGLGPRGYSTFVDNKGKVWSSDFGTNSILQFNPITESFTIFPGNKQNIQTLQMNGIENKIWAGQQGVDQVVLFERIAN